MIIKNITNSFQNITRHLTGAKKIVTSSFVIITLCFLNILLCSSNHSSALTYSSSVDIGFTFDPTIVLTLSGDLVINNLAPGSTSDSNTIDITVATNNATGYTLLATAGASSTNTNLVNTANSSYKFTSIATNANLASLTTDNTWGFSYSSNNGSTWSNYSGLPLDNNDEGATGKQLAQTSSMSSNTPIKFKIGAKASNSQAAGTYTNTINFYAVPNPAARSYTINYINYDNIAQPSTMPPASTGLITGRYIYASNNEPQSVDPDYYFDGWCSVYPTYNVDDNGYNCSGETIYSGASIDVGTGAGNFTINLYPIWTYNAGSNLVFLEINNDSNARVYVDGTRMSDSSDIYEYTIGEEAYITIDEPSFTTCEGTWSWTADIYYSDGSPYDSYSGAPSAGFSLYMNDNFIVEISEDCSGGGGGQL